MTRFVLEKGKSFDQAHESVQNIVAEMFGREFQNLDELLAELFKPNDVGIPRLPGNVYFLNEGRVRIDTLPYIIKEWPLIYNKGPAPYGHYEIAKLKVSD